jgi:hypothetical protein
VAVDPAALPGLKDDLVEAERRHAEVPAQRQEALAVGGVESRRRDTVLHRTVIISCRRATPSKGDTNGDT